MCGVLVVIFAASAVVGFQQGIGPFELWKDILSEIEFVGPIEKIRAASYRDGFNEGRKDGIEAGMESGYNKGYNEGFSDGEEHALDYLAEAGETYDVGYEDGYKKGLEDGQGISAEKDEQEKPEERTYSGGGGKGGFTDYGAAEQVCDYVLNKNTRKFHYSHCSSVSNIKPDNREYFSGTREEAIARGFEPCGRCEP